MKIPLVVVNGNNDEHNPYRTLSWASASHFTKILEKYFTFIPYDNNINYKLDTLFIIPNRLYKDQEFRDQFKDYRVIVDCCLEGNMPDWDLLYKNKIKHHIIMYGSVPVNHESDIFYVPNFFWYNEALTVPAMPIIDNFNYSKKFLMPIGRKTKYRDKLVKMLDPYLEDCYWSYVRRGKVLPFEDATVAGAKRWNTRYDNIQWYEDTCFSLVVESFTTWPGVVPFLTEKIFKPIRHRHPFMVIGAPGILKYLKTQNFETYENLFDESYDSVLDFETKMLMIIDNIKNFIKSSQDTITIEKAQHNHNLFYNYSVIVDSINKSIAEPIINFYEKN